MRSRDTPRAFADRCETGKRDLRSYERQTRVSEGLFSTVTTRRMRWNRLQIKWDVLATVGGEKLKCRWKRATGHERN